MLSTIEFRNQYHIEPLGALRKILSHPINDSEAIKVVIFQEHRYAFFLLGQMGTGKEVD